MINENTGYSKDLQNHPRCECHECTQARARENHYVQLQRWPVFWPTWRQCPICGRLDCLEQHVICSAYGGTFPGTEANGGGTALV